MRLYNLTKKILVSNNVVVADKFREKLLGLIPKKGLEGGSALMIKGCMSVHTCFMSFPIDVVFTDKDLKVIDIITLKPWRFSKFYFEAENAFEFNANYVYDKISIGDILKIED